MLNLCYLFIHCLVEVSHASLEEDIDHFLKVRDLLSHVTHWTVVILYKCTEDLGLDESRGEASLIYGHTLEVLVSLKDGVEVVSLVRLFVVLKEVVDTKDLIHKELLLHVKTYVCPHLTQFHL